MKHIEAFCAIPPGCTVLGSWTCDNKRSTPGIFVLDEPDKTDPTNETIVVVFITEEKIYNLTLKRPLNGVVK